MQPLFNAFLHPLQQPTSRPAPVLCKHTAGQVQLSIPCCCKRREERRSRRGIQQPLAAATGSSTPALEYILPQQGGQQGNGAGVLFPDPPPQQQQQALPQHGSSNSSCTHPQGSAAQGSNGAHELPAHLHTSTGQTFSRHHPGAANGTVQAACLQGAAGALMGPIARKSPLHRPCPQPRSMAAADCLEPVPSYTAAHAQQQQQQQQQEPQQLILFPPSESSAPPSSSHPPPSLNGMGPTLQPPLQPSRPHAPSKKPSAVVGGRWGKWVLHMRPWFAILRPWWCRKAKRRRRPRPNRFRMTVSRTSDLDILHEFRLHGQLQRQLQQRQQQRQQATFHPAPGQSSSGRHASTGQFTTLVMQPRHTIADPARSAIHTLGGALSNRNQPIAHFTLDGGLHWSSTPFCNVRTAQGPTVLAAQLDCSPRSSSSPSPSSNTQARPMAQAAQDIAAVTSSASQPCDAAGPAHAVLQVIVSNTPQPPVQGSGTRRWRHHLLQLQPGACYMLEEAVTHRQRARTSDSASYPLSIVPDPLLPALSTPVAAPNMPTPLPPPFPLQLSPVCAPSGAAASAAHRPLPIHEQQEQQQQQQQQQQEARRAPQLPLLHRLLQQPVVLVASVHMVAGRQRCPEDDAAARCFQAMWHRSNLLHPSLLVYTTHRCWRSYLQLWKDKQHVLQAPDVLILANGTRIMYQVAGGGWQEDMQWRATMNRGWDRRQVVQAVEAVAARMNAPPPTLLQPPQARQADEALLQGHPQPRGALQHQHLPQGLGSPWVRSDLSTGAACSPTCAAAAASSLAAGLSGEAGEGLLVPQGRQQHAPHTGSPPPVMRVRADVVKEQNSHRVRILVRTQAAGALLMALQAELEGAQQRQLAEAQRQRVHEAQHHHLPHVVPFVRPHAPQLHRRHAMQPTGSTASSNPATTTQASPVLAPTSRTHASQQQQQQQQQLHKHHPGVLQHPLGNGSSSSSSSTDRSHSSHAGTGEPSGMASHFAAPHPMAWSLVLQPPHVLGQGRAWAAVDVLPVSAGVGPAVAHVLARFAINTPPPLQQQQQAMHGAAHVPVVACTNSVQDHESMQQVATQSIMHVPAAACKRARRQPGGSGAHSPGAPLAHGQHDAVVSHAWGASGILEGLSLLGLS